ncbi:MAG: hypothetical protein N2383_01415 [Caldilineales bacterium]|nr:hypothetical protein [Caldilineales bacterium]
MTELFHRPGFLGTAANFAADTTLVLLLLVAALFTIGAYLAKKAQAIERGRSPDGLGPERARVLFRHHRRVQTTGVILSTVLVLWMMLLPYRDFVAPGLPALWAQPFYLVTTVHAVIGFFAFLIGNFVVLRGHRLVPQRLRFADYKPWMRAAYGLYMATMLLGVGVYVVWFVTNPNPPVYR